MAVGVVGCLEARAGLARVGGDGYARSGAGRRSTATAVRGVAVRVLRQWGDGGGGSQESWPPLPQSLSGLRGDRTRHDARPSASSALFAPAAHFRYHE